MRVRPRGTCDGETGAVVLIVAITMTALIGAAAFAVDAGGAWQAQRRLHTATDAAALAAAQEYAAGNDDGCGTTDVEYVIKNDPDASVTECNRVGTSKSGYVTVSATRSFEFQFAPIFGVDQSDIGSSTTAQYGSPLAVTGLRPLAICMFFPALEEWLNAPDGPTGPSAPITVPFTREGIGCGDAPGNWEWLDVEGDTGGGARELGEEMRNGSKEPVTIPGDLSPKTGRVASIDDDLAYLVSNGIEFPIPLYDTKEGQGKSKDTVYHVVGVATVKLLDFQIGGNQDDDSFTFIFTPKTIQGTCCSGDGIDTGTKVVNICAVNADFSTSRCQP
jgi:Flp pilus assembly protein TadG